MILLESKLKIFKLKVKKKKKKIIKDNKGVEINNFHY